MKCRTPTLLLDLLLIILIIGMNSLVWSESYQYKVCFKDSCFDVGLAVTAQERERGLMFREKMGITEGMLFIFEEEDKHSFWMKNTFIPLDIIWVNRDKQVVYISKNNRPCLMESCPIIYPDRDALYVLEVNAGVVDSIGLKMEDKINFDIK